MAPPTPTPAYAERGVQPDMTTARPASRSGVLLTKIIMRALTFAFTFIALIVLTTNKTKYEGETILKFNDFKSYRYVLFTALLGLLYSLLQTALTIVHLTSGNRVSNILVYLDFYGDLVLMYALATGAAACFGLTVDLQTEIAESYGDNKFYFDEFLAKSKATGSMLFLGSVCASVSVVLSAFGLSDRF